MVNDLLPVQGELCPLPQTSPSEKKEKQEEQIVVLSEDDPKWVDCRHQHIAIASSSLQTDFKKFKDQSNVAQLQLQERTHPYCFVLEL